MKTLTNILGNIHESYQEFSNADAVENFLPLTIFFTMMYVIAKGFLFYYKENDVINPKRKGLFVAHAVFLFASGSTALGMLVICFLDPFTTVLKHFPAFFCILITAIAIPSKVMIWQKRPFLAQTVILIALFLFSKIGYGIPPFLVFLAIFIYIITMTVFLTKRLAYHIRDFGKLFTNPKSWFKS